MTGSRPLSTAPVPGNAPGPATTPAPDAPAPATPKPANPEPAHEHTDPEKGRVPSPAPGKPEHPAN